MASKELEKVLELMKSRPVVPNLTFQEQREAFETMPGFPLAEDVRCEEVDAGGVPGEWITTPEAKGGNVVYYLHGGGYVLGSVNTHREMISRISRATGARALAINYRLAPEDPFPAAVEDAVVGYKWLLSSGVEPSRVVIAGDSAGGGLTVAALVALRDAGEPLPAAGVCISPWADMECTGVAKLAGREGGIEYEGILKMAKTYVGEADLKTPLASPIHADLTGLPPLLIQVGGAEELIEDAILLEARAKQCGIDVTLETWDDMFHVWHTFAPMLPEGQQAIDRIGEFVRGKMG
ncbi:MAG: alpha/beta hydrolase [Dehalococcoidales bacterium]|nr:MAG: alpha/beta hydrolase [Dehalococcoidales bacterium]